MNLEKLFKMQKELDERILDRFPELRNEDLLDKKILALQVELGELAQNWRGFKFWSEIKRPNIEQWIDCKFCDGTGDLNYETVQEDAEGSGGREYIDCEKCDSSGTSHMINPLLEEYVDCLHFILSIGLEKKKFIDFEMELKATFDDLIVYKDETITKQFNNLFLEVGLLYDATHDSAYAFKNEFESYSNVFSCFIGLGELLGFTEDEIEQVYFAKNKVNHQRQEDGY